MNYRKMIVVIAGILTFIILLGSCAENNQPKEVDLSNGPYIAYMKMEGKIKDKYYYSIKLSSFDASSQILVMKARGLIPAAQGEILFYKTGEIERNNLYFMDYTGESILIVKDLTFYKPCENGYALTCATWEDPGTIIYNEYTPEGSLIVEETFEDVYELALSANGTIILLEVKNGEEEQTYGDRSLFIYQDGQMHKVVEKGVISGNEESISSNGVIIYLSDDIIDDGDDIIGTLYRKELDGEPEKIVESSTRDHAISNDGGLIASVIKDENGNDMLFYQYDGQEPVLVENIAGYVMGRNSNTLYYIAGDKTDWQLDLYRVSESDAPVLISDKVSNIVDVSADGTTVVYGKNYDSSLNQADLYIAKEGIQPELVEEGMFAGESFGEIVGCSAKLYYDGTAVAYQKNVGDVQFEDLYVKELGKPPVKIDSDVIWEYCFIK